MLRTIRVISGQKDGADLRREQRKERYYSRCDGTADDANINEAIQSANKGMMWAVPAERWEEIFGAPGSAKGDDGGRL